MENGIGDDVRFAVNNVSHADKQSSEQRLLSAHIRLAIKGQKTSFPLRIKDDLIAVLPPESGAPGRVLNVPLEATFDIVLVPYDKAMYRFSITSEDEEGERDTRSYFQDDGQGWIVTCSNHDAPYEFKLDYIRDVACRWARQAFEAEALRKHRAAGFGPGDISNLLGLVEGGVWAGLSKIRYVVSSGNFRLAQTCNEPFLTLRNNGYGGVNCKVSEPDDRRNSDWKTALLSMPMELRGSMSLVRDALSSRNGAFVEIGLTHDDDRFDTNIVGRTPKDLVDAKSTRGVEFPRFLEACRAMASAMIDQGDFSVSTTEALRWFSTLPDDGKLKSTHQSRTLRAAIAELAGCLEDDMPAFTRFLEKADWELPFGPQELMLAKLNILQGKPVHLDICAAPGFRNATPGNRR